MFSRLREVVQRCKIIGRCGVLWGRFHLQFVSFSTFAGISSGPNAFLGYRAFSCFVTPFSPISRDWIEGNGDGPFVGVGSCSSVKTDLKWAFSAFVTLSLSVVFTMSSTFIDGMLRFSVIFFLTKDQNCLGFVVRLSPKMLFI